MEEETPIVGRGTYPWALDATRWREGPPRTSPSGPWTPIEARTSINDTRTPQCPPTWLPPPSPQPYIYNWMKSTSFCSSFFTGRHNVTSLLSRGNEVPTMPKCVRVCYVSNNSTILVARNSRTVFVWLVVKWGAGPFLSSSLLEDSRFFARTSACY